MAVVSNGDGLPDGHPLLEPAAALVLLTTETGAALAPAGVDATGVGSAAVDVGSAVAELRRRGLTRVLCEGGPTLNGALLRAGLVDEICVTTCGLAVGGPAPRIVAGDVENALPFTLAHLLFDDGMLFARWTGRGPAAA
jgi:riboflavin biosynthesis pyrimidine reductase